MSPYSQASVSTIADFRANLIFDIAHGWPRDRSRRPDLSVAVTPRVHVGVLPNRPVVQVADLAELAEDLGFAGIWVADSQSIFRDAFAALTLSATRTRALSLATAVTNPVTRHPATIACSFATLDELSEGRAILGIGVGESSVETLSLRPARLARLEQAALVLRGLMSGDEVEWDGARIRMTWPVRAIPIVFASSGPRSLETAGRVADGVLFQVGAEPAMVRYAFEHIDRGAAGRKVTRYMRLACSVDHDREAARRAAAGYVAAAAGTIFRSAPEVLDPALLRDITTMKERYDYFEHTSTTAAHAELVTERIIDAVAIAGTPADVIPRFRELSALGVDEFVLTVTTPQPEVTLRILAEEVLPQL
jgi:5,10-methylenetetrahydromethanopterin reductase